MTLEGKLWSQKRKVKEKQKLKKKTIAFFSFYIVSLNWFSNKRSPWWRCTYPIVWVWIAHLCVSLRLCFFFFFFFFFFSVGLVYCLQDLQIWKNTNLTLKLCLTVPFSPLKIILLQYFQFLIFNNKRYPNRLLVSVWHWLKKSVFFTIQIIFATFIGLIALFGTVYGFYYTISATDFTVLFQLPFSFIYSIFSKKFSISKK